MTLVHAHTQLQHRALHTARSVLRPALAQTNKQINAFVDKCADSPLPHGPLAGWTIGIKANIATKTGTTSCGSRALIDYQSPYQATAVQLLADAGASIIGKTNMDEFGMGSYNNHSVHGKTLNPAHPNRAECTHSPGGSSGGSASAVAAGLCRAALGSDTGGSVRLPAAWCGVVGFKPSYGRISRFGLVSYASSLDTVGVLARTVADVKHVYRAAARPDVRDMTCISAKTRQKIDSLVESRDLSRVDRSRPLSGVRIGVPCEYWVTELSRSVLDAWRAAADTLASCGAEIVDVSLPRTREALPAYYIIALAEASSNLARYDGVRFGTRLEAKLPETIANASLKYAGTRSHGFGAEVQRRILLGTYVMTSAAFDHYYRPSQKIRRLIQNDFSKIFALPDIRASMTATGGVDAILFPTAMDCAPEFDSIDGDRVAGYVNDVMTVPVSLAGIPAVSVPVGVGENGMPVGMQLVAQYGDEEMLLSIAENLQQK